MFYMTAKIIGEKKKIVKIRYYKMIPGNFAL